MKVDLVINIVKRPIALHQYICKFYDFRVGISRQLLRIS